VFSHPRSSFSRHQTYRSAFRLVLVTSLLSIPICPDPSPPRRPQNVAQQLKNCYCRLPIRQSLAGHRNQMRATFDPRTQANSSCSSMKESDTRSGSCRAGDRVGIGYGIFSSLFVCFLLLSFILASPPPPAIPHSTLIYQESPLFPSLSTSRPLLRFQSPIRRLRSPRRLFLAYDAALLVTGRTQGRFSFFIPFFPFHAHCRS